MSEEFVTSDLTILDLLRQCGSMTVTQLAEAMDVTATAVRQRLNRLLAQQFIERTAAKAGRGRPTHHYQLTEKGRRKSGANFADLAMALWQEIRAITDPEVRVGLIRRLAKRMAVMYADRITGRTLDEKMRALATIFDERRIPITVEEQDGLPVLHASVCPYPDLAEQDRAICAMERLMFTELLGEDIRLTQCRLDGGDCCTFGLN